MSFSFSDLPHLRWSLLAFVSVLAVGASAVYLSRNVAGAAESAKKTAQRQLAEARNKLNAARDDRENMSTYAAEYEAWVKRGVIGEERRLDLIEDMEALRRRRPVLDFKYAIAPQAPYAPVPALESGNFELRQSTMSLQMELLHEEQLISFFDALRSGQKGQFMLDRCSLERSPAAAGSGAQLKAECSGGWLTLNIRNPR